MRKPSSLLLFTALCISLSQSATAQKAKGSSAMSAHQQSFKNFDAVLKDPNKANPELEKDLSVLLEPLVKRV
ncbi:MAG TPA: hypothetical protein VD794_14165, partial [Flavisolibacter sp.]|nr:hypothetical protein [Flavisolibacter sp.]